MVILPLQATGLEVKRRGKRILGPITHRIDEGGITMVIGPNGAGKTTFLRALHGLERAKDAVSWAVPVDQAQRHQSFVFQRPTTLRRTVRDNIAFPLLLAGTPRAQARQTAEEMASKVGLADHLNLRASELSGGECQKMALVRALVTKPQVLFLDEPCANLDGHATSEIEAILLEARDRGTTIIMSSHAMGQARRLADEVIFLLNGRIHEHGPAPAFFDTPKTPQAKAHLQGDIIL